MVRVSGGRLYHVGLTRERVLQEFAAHGPEAVLRGFTGTPAEAAALIAADPREVFVLDPCDRQDARGWCQGHRRICARCGAFLRLEGGETVSCASCGEIGGPA